MLLVTYLSEGITGAVEIHQTLTVIHCQKGSFFNGMRIILARSHSQLSIIANGKGEAGSGPGPGMHQLRIELHGLRYPMFPEAITAINRLFIDNSISCLQCFHLDMTHATHACSFPLCTHEGR